jgi:hypothetical protein
MLRAPWSAALAAVALVACHFDGSGVPSGDDGGDDDVDGGPTPPADAALDGPDDPADAAVDAAPPPPDAQACPSSYVAVDGQASRYRLVTNTDDWLAAERDCEDDGAATGGGTHLLVLDDAEELTAVDSRINPAVWIGMSDRVDEGTFVLVTGPGAVFRPFRSGEPNDGGLLPSEDCIELNGVELNDEGCGTNRQYVCECDGVDADPEAYTPEDDVAPPTRR